MDFSSRAPWSFFFVCVGLGQDSASSRGIYLLQKVLDRWVCFACHSKYLKIVDVTCELTAGLPVPISTIALSAGWRLSRAPRWACLQQRPALKNAKALVRQPPRGIAAPGLRSKGERKLGEVLCVPPAEGPVVHAEGDGQGSSFFLGVPTGGGGASSEASFKHWLLGTQPAGRKGVGSELKARFLLKATSTVKGRRWGKRKKGRDESEGFSTPGEGLSWLRTISS